MLEMFMGMIKLVTIKIIFEFFVCVRLYQVAPFITTDVMCNTAIYADDTTLYSKCHQSSDLWLKLQLASELESDLRDTVDWGRKWPVDFNVGEAQLVLFDQSNNNGATDVKIDRSALEKISRKYHLLRCWG